MGHRATRVRFPECAFLSELLYRAIAAPNVCPSSMGINLSLPPDVKIRYPAVRLRGVD